MVAGWTPPPGWYLPPAWPLVELVDTREGAGAAAHRGLVGFDGVVGEPPDRVRLGWRSGSRRAVAQTGSLRPALSDTRFRRPDALHLALAGAPWTATFNAGPTDPAATDPAATDLAVEAIAAQPALWRHLDVDLDGTRQRAEVAEAAPGVLVGYLPDAHLDITFAGRGLDPAKIVLRVLNAATDYDLSLFQPATSRDLTAAEDRFWS